jgi:hypothetical protein
MNIISVIAIPTSTACRWQRADTDQLEMKARKSMTQHTHSAQHSRHQLNVNSQSPFTNRLQCTHWVQCDAVSARQ